MRTVDLVFSWTKCSRNGICITDPHPYFTSPASTSEESCCPTVHLLLTFSTVHL